MKKTNILHNIRQQSSIHGEISNGFIGVVRLEEYRGLAIYFILSMEENHLVNVLIDSDVLKQGKEGEIMAVAYLAKRCIDLKGKTRSSMKEVAMELERKRMLRNPSRDAQNHSDIGFSRNSTGWVDVWTSMRSDLDVNLTSFPDVHPLLDMESCRRIIAQCGPRLSSCQR
ncbi:Protein kinase domain-containing protein [Psidium guajava]|nr:Protein kinase domain-containing protein [Psidium guajava]